MDRRLPLFRRRDIVTLAIGSSIGLLGAKGCDSTYIGVQDYGTIIGNVVDGGGKPIAGALVNSTGSTATFRTSGDGAFTLARIAVGQQTVRAQAAGYATNTADVIVAKDQSVAAGNIALVQETAH